MKLKIIIYTFAIYLIVLIESAYGIIISTINNKKTTIILSHLPYYHLNQLSQKEKIDKLTKKK